MLLNAGMPLKDAIDLKREAWANQKNPYSAEQIKGLIKDNVDVKNGDDPTADLLKKSIDDWSIYPTDKAAAVLPQARQVYSDFVAKYKDVGLAQDAFSKYAKSTFSISSVNGDNDIMRNAPETIFTRPGEMDLFNKHWEDKRGEIATLLGGGLDGFEVKTDDKKYKLSLDTGNSSPIDPVTGVASYYVKANGNNIQDSSGRFLTFSFNQDATELSKKREDYIAGLSNGREQMNMAIRNANTQGRNIMLEQLNKNQSLWNQGQA